MSVLFTHPPTPPILAARTFVLSSDGKTLNPWPPRDTRYHSRGPTDCCTEKMKKQQMSPWYNTRGGRSPPTYRRTPSDQWPRGHRPSVAIAGRRRRHLLVAADVIAISCTPSANNVIVLVLCRFSAKPVFVRCTLSGRITRDAHDNNNNKYDVNNNDDDENERFAAVCYR